MKVSQASAVFALAGVAAAIGSNAVAQPAAKKSPARPAAKKTPVKPTAKVPAQPAGIGGLYLRVMTYSYPTFSISNEAWYFTNDGKVAYGPKGGLDPFDWEKAAQEKPGNVGTYRIEGDKITFTWGGGRKPETRKFARKGKDLELDGIFTSRVPQFKPGQKLKGHWSWGATVGRGTGAVVGAARGLTLNPNGTFSSGSIGSASIESSAGSAAGKSESETSGTYHFSGNTLVLKRVDGQVSRHTVYPFGDNDQTANPEFLYLDGSMMSLSKG